MPKKKKSKSKAKKRMPVRRPRRNRMGIEDEEMVMAGATAPGTPPMSPGTLARGDMDIDASMPVAPPMRSSRARSPRMSASPCRGPKNASPM